MNTVDIVLNWSLDTCMSKNLPKFNSPILVKFTLTNRDKDTHIYLYTYISTYTYTLFIIFLIYIKLCGFDPPPPFPLQ